MRKETTTLCIFVFIWNLIINPILLPKVQKCVYSGVYHINHKIRQTKLCELCKFPIDNNGTTPNSSERDVILLVAFRKLLNLYPLVRSIRTTGCKAKIIVFLDQFAIFSQSEEYFQRLSQCGVQFIPLDEYDPSFLDDVYYYRYIIYHNFLFVNRNEIDRVIAVDLFDSIAQHDPFTTDFKTDRMYFSNEGYMIKENDFNLKNLEFAFAGLKKANKTFKRSEVNYHELIKKPIINGGIQAGGVEPFIKFSQFMTRIGNPETMSAYGPDQAFLNYYVHTGAFKGLFKYETDIKKTGFISTIGVWLTDEDSEFPNFDTFGKIERQGYKPAIIHQFDRSHSLFNAVMSACPNTHNISDYARTKKDRSAS